VIGEDYTGWNMGGAVQIIYGGLTGLGNADFMVTQDWLGTGAYGNNRFGEPLAAGDFNGDGWDDLAMSALTDERDYLSQLDCGTVDIAYGSSSGITASGAQEWLQGLGGLGDSCEAFDFFGTALAVGNFNGDRYMDPAIGVPREDSGRLGGIIIEDTGLVHVLPGSPNGLTASGAQIWTQDSDGVRGEVDEGDRFGAAVASWPTPAAWLSLLPIIRR
jgi:hypothetical protein